MSYILEALKRADAERERGAIPGLHAHATAIGDIDDGPRRGGTWRWIVLGFLIGAAGLAAGWWFALGRNATGPTPVADASVASPARGIEPAPLQTPPNAAPAPMASPPVARPPPTPAAAAPKATAAPAKVPQVTSPPSPPKPAAATAPAAATRAAPPALPSRAQALGEAQPAPAAPPAPRIPRFSELPENVRNEIPQLAIGGSMYSDNRANRMLILNGQLLHEGDQPVPGLVLEQIRPKAAVLNYKGQRYEINY